MFANQDRSTCANANAKHISMISMEATTRSCPTGNLRLSDGHTHCSRYVATTELIRIGTVIIGWLMDFYSQIT